MIIGKNLVVQKDSSLLLNDISIEIPRGRITCFLGSSGAGKTSLLRTIVRLNSEYQGSLTIDGKEDSSLSSQAISSYIGFVFQQLNLFNVMTVIENCTLALRVVNGIPADDARLRVKPLLQQLGIERLADRFPNQLSGGQQQRVAIVRALSLNPHYLLLDEPTSALDPENAKNLAALLKDLANKGIAIALASQDLFFISLMLDRAYLLKDGKQVALYDSQNDKSMPLLLENFLRSVMG